MIRLRLTMILWVSWISLFCATLTAFIQAVLQGNRKSFCFLSSIWSVYLNSPLCLLFPSFLPAPLLFSSCFVCSVLLVAPPLQNTKEWFTDETTSLSFHCFCFMPLPVFSPFPFSLSSLFETRLSAASTAVVSASVRCCVFIPHFLLSVFISLSLRSDRDGRMCCLFLCSSYGFSFFLSFNFPVLFAASVFSLALSAFLCRRWKDQSCRMFVVFALRVFPPVLCHMLLVWRLGSNELTHRALLMCSGGNQLNYAHCGGEGIHNTGIKLLKVTQYLALQLPAVYRRRGMFGRTDVHMSYACVGHETDWGQTSRLMAYIGLQCSLQRYKMTVCWQIPS